MAKWGRIIATGVAGFAVIITGVALLGLDGAVQILTDRQFVMLALAALAVAALFAFIRERRHHRAAMVALNNLAEGLSMFDGAARLVLCNTRYIEMSQLPPEGFRGGAPFTAQTP